MSRAVFDANVLASGVASAGGPPGRLLNLWAIGVFELVVSEHILAEVRRTLRKPYFRARLLPEQSRMALDRLRRHAEIVEITFEVRGVATHPEDDLVLATAVSAGSAYLVSGDQGLLRLGAYEGVTIVRPRAFLDSLEPRSEGVTG